MGAVTSPSVHVRVSVFGDESSEGRHGLALNWSTSISLALLGLFLVSLLLRPFVF